MISKSHFGVYGLIFNQSKTHVLVIRKARGPYTGRYDLPGGLMEDGETERDTLIREIREETGCSTINIPRKITDIEIEPREYIDKNGDPYLFSHKGAIYSVEISGEPTQTGDGQDSEGCVWLPVEELLNSHHDKSPMLMKAYGAETVCHSGEGRNP